MSNKKLTWRHLKALNDLYESGKTEAKILDNAFIRNLLKNKRLMGFKLGSERIIQAFPGFSAYYEQHLKERYLVYRDFLLSNRIEASARQHFDEYDLDAFIFISLHKDEIRTDLTTIRHFSSVFFRTKGSKYLENNTSIARVVCSILEIDSFPGQDPKTNVWRFVVDHPHPKLVVLCENLANLKQPFKAREHQLELWYVGGNNISIVEQIGPDKLKIPIYYTCDWDLAGLEIYTRIQKILSGKGVVLHLLEPYDKATKLDVASPDHRSLWEKGVPYSGLEVDAFSNRQLDLISQLILENNWIEEESQDLISLLKYNSAIPA